MWSISALHVLHVAVCVCEFVYEHALNGPL